MVWFSSIINTVGALFIGPAVFGALLFALLAFCGLLWSPFAAIRCARVARGRGLNTSLFAWKGFAFSLLYLFPWSYLMARIQGAEASRLWAGFAYVVLYYVWLVVGIIIVIAFIAAELPKALNPDPALPGKANDLNALIYLMLAPFINAILWAVSLLLLIRRDRLDRRNQGDTAASSASAYTDPEGAAAAIIPDRAYTNPFGFSLIGAATTLFLGIISIGLMFEVF